MELFDSADHRFELNGVAFDAIATAWRPSRPDHFSVRKTRWSIERYRELAHEFTGAQVIELGIDQGGSTAMLALMFEPTRLAAFEISATPVDALGVFAKDHRLEDVLRLHWGIDQSDVTSVLARVDEDFAAQPLDLIIDDASHALDPTKASFEALFPRLRPGGLFIIEDWSHEHHYDRHYAEILDRDDANAKLVRERIAADISARGLPSPPLSRLIVELVIASGYAPEVVADVRVRAGWCEVRRGPASVPSPFVLRDYLGSRGCEILPESHTPHA